MERESKEKLSQRWGMMGKGEHAVVKQGGGWLNQLF